MTVQEVPRSVRIPADVDERLTRLAQQTGRSKSFYLRELVTDGLDDLEYAYGLAARVESIRAGKRRTRPIEELMAEMGITRAELHISADETR